MNYATMLIRLGRIDEAARLLDRDDPDFRLFRGSDTEFNLHHAWHELAVAQNDPWAAVEHLERTFIIRDSLIESQRETNLSQVAEELLRLEDDNRHRSVLASNSRNRRVIVVLGLCVGLLCLGGVILLRLYDKRRRSREEIAHQLDTRNSDFVTQSVETAMLRDTVGKIRAVCDRVADSPGRCLDEIRSLVRNAEIGNRAWDGYLSSLGKASPEFLRRLYHIQPSLTNAEIRMAAMCLHNLSSKEVASMTNRSINTVHTIRRTMRGKLGITGSAEAYMHRVMEADERELDRLRDAAGSNTAP